MECRLGLATASAVAGWAQGAIAGVAGAPAIGAVAIIAVVIMVVAIMVAVIGTVATGMAAIGVVVTGMAAIGVITSSSLATSGFPTGGAGVGAIRTDTTVAVTRTITTAMGTGTAMVAATDMITVSPVRGTAIAADQGSLNCSGGSPALAIIVAVLTGSWGPRRGERFKLTSAPMEM